MFAQLPNILSSCILGSPSTIQEAQTQLTALEGQPGYCVALNSIAEQPGDCSVQLLALQCLRNFVHAHWKPRPNSAVTLQEAEKAALRERLLSSYPAEQDNRLALHRSLLIARIAHADCPTQWPQLLPAVMGALTPEAPLLTQVRAAQTLRYVVGEVASRRMPADVASMAPVAPLAHSSSWGRMAAQMWAPMAPRLVALFHSAFREWMALPQGAPSSEGHVMLCGLMVKTLRLVLAASPDLLQTMDWFAPHSRSPRFRRLCVGWIFGAQADDAVRQWVPSFCQQVAPAVAHLVAFGGCSAGLAHRAMSVLKAFVRLLGDLLDHHALRFAPFLREPLQLAITTLSTYCGDARVRAAIPEAFMAAMMRFLRDVLSCPNYTRRSADPAGKAASQLLAEVVTADVTTALLHNIINYALILPEDALEKWESDPCAFFIAEDTPGLPTIRCAGESLVSELVKFQPSAGPACLAQMITEMAQDMRTRGKRKPKVQAESRVPLRVKAPFAVFRRTTRRKTMGAGKPHGLHAGRKLQKHHCVQRWHDKEYKKHHFGAALKANPFMGASFAKGIVVDKVGVEAKQPNSAVRKCVRVQLVKNGKKIGAFVPCDGCLNFIDDNDEVLVSGFGRRGHAKGDIPGIRFKVVKVAGISLKALFLHKKEKIRS
ncbi:putative 40S ribosomal protein S23 [Paratrimastix pyriformis]|uniref:40S ribosomal protein S23 n=1 Tax=Paratrimastix pyriformis TaxID=342808 RepID=A0ABQ8UK59_9EUKA|nr:putative 40S ribosomal protein S23 [Paratrimastix pyriformis]